MKDLVGLVYPEPGGTRETSMRRTLAKLDRDGLVNRISYRPDDYAGCGTLPLACGLALQGVVWAHENCSWADPKELREDHSPLTLEHEIKRARFHMTVVRACEERGVEVFWRKTDLNHTVKPDDVFAIGKAGAMAYYFFELENKRKSLMEMLEKYQRYEDYLRAGRWPEEWKNVRTFTVLTQIRSEESRRNILRFLAGEPVTEYRNGKGRTLVNPTPIMRDSFWFSTEKDPLTFKTPKDYATRTYRLP